MNSTEISREDLLRNTDAILHVREGVLKKKIKSLYTRMAIDDCYFLKQVWPEIRTSEEKPREQVYLSTLQANSGLPMSEISQTVERMNNKGLIIWERGSSGTYIKLSDKGFREFRAQQDIMFGYVERIIRKLGKDHLREIVAALSELESVLESELPE
ncbi:MAG: hypothetical protein Q4B85_04535 [Lachnospiraceae bacterium]|nr:hypothetical protein [Lachnospiraceae bacterium]